MGFLKDIFKRGPAPETEFVNGEPLLEHSIIIKFSKGKAVTNEVFELERQLQWTLDNSVEGSYTGHELAHDDSTGSLYFHTTNADALLNRIIPVLRRAEFLKGAKASVRTDPANPNEKPTEIEI